MERYAALSDDSALLVKEPELDFVPVSHTAWWEKFQYDLYDWDDPAFKRRNRGKEAYRPVKLTQGYFMMVSPRSYKQMTEFPDGSPKRWCASVQRAENSDQITAVYAYRSGRKDFGEPACVRAHRELLGISNEPSLIGDHVNGYGLDNRGDLRGSVNLRRTTKRINSHNARRGRVVHVGLPPGVERCGKNRDGKQRYGGKVCIRLSKKKVVTIRTKRQWLTPEPAAQWYLNHLERLHKRAEWVHNPKSVCMPFFPPRWDQEPVEAPKATPRSAQRGVDSLVATF